MRGRRMKVRHRREGMHSGRGAGIIHGLPHLSRLQSSQSLHQNNCFFIFALTQSLPPTVLRSFSPQREKKHSPTSPLAWPVHPSVSCNVMFFYERTYFSCIVHEVYFGLTRKGVCRTSREDLSRKDKQQLQIHYNSK